MPDETSAGDAFRNDLDRHLADPEFRRGYEEQTRQLETSAGEAGGREVSGTSDRWPQDPRTPFGRFAMFLKASEHWSPDQLLGKFAGGRPEIVVSLGDLRDAFDEHTAAVERAETAEREARWMRLELRTRREAVPHEETCHNCGHWLYVHREDIGCVACACAKACPPKPLEDAK